MHKTLRTGLILLLIIPSLTIVSACAKKTTTVKKETKKTDTAELERQKALEAERQRKEAEQRRFQAAKAQFMNEDIYFQKGSNRLQPQARAIDPPVRFPVAC